MLQPQVGLTPLAWVRAYDKEWRGLGLGSYRDLSHASTTLPNIMSTRGILLVKCALHKEITTGSKYIWSFLLRYSSPLLILSSNHLVLPEMIQVAYTDANPNPLQSKHIVVTFPL